MSAGQHKPRGTGGTARLWPVCLASRDKFTSYASKDRPDAGGRVPCPICCKVVKLGPANGVIGSRIVIPHHHAQPNEANFARIRERCSEPQLAPGYNWCLVEGGTSRHPLEWTGKKWWGIAVQRPFDESEVSDPIPALPPAVNATKDTPK